MDQEQQRHEVGDASKEIASSYQTSKEDIVAYFVLGVSIAAIVSILPILIISRTKQSKIASLDTQYQENVATQLVSLKQEKADQEAISKQISALTSALSSRTENSLFLAALSKNTFKRSKWTAMTMSDDTVSLSISADSYDDMAKTVSAYRAMDSVKSVKLTSAGRNDSSGKIDFSLELSFDKSLYVIKQSSAAANPDDSAAVPIL